MNDLGPLAFTKRGPRRAAVIASLLGAATLVGGLHFFENPTAHDLVLGGLLLLVGLGLAALAWWLGSIRWEFYSDGLVSHRWGKVASVRYAEVTELSYLEVDGSGMHRSLWMLVLETARGEKVGVRLQPDLVREKELPALHQRLLEQVTLRCRAQLPTGIRWSGLSLRSDGVVLANGMLLRFGPDLTLRSTQARRHFRMKQHRTELLRNGEPVAELWADEPNYEIGLRLFAELAKKNNGTTRSEAAPAVR